MKQCCHWLIITALFCFTFCAFAVLPPTNRPLPNFERRSTQAVRETALSGEQGAGASELRARIPNVTLEFDPVSHSPAMIASPDGFLSGPEGIGRGISAAGSAGILANDPNRITKAFVNEHRRLFGHGADALDNAVIQRDFVTPHNGLRTVVWQQQVDGIPVFEALLISHVTRSNELVNIASHFMADPVQAADHGVPNRAALLAAPNISAQQAVAIAARDVGEQADAAQIVPVEAAAASAEQAQNFTASFLAGQAETKLIWLPVDSGTLRLCRDVTLTGRARQEMFRVLVDVETGAVQVRHCLTDYLSDASYRVFTSDSPSPFSPAYPTPVTNQPPLVSRTLITLPALDTNASPAGWINDGGNETLGNNVDAHTDWNNDNLPDLPRPQGSPFRVFDFPMDLTTQNPTNYNQAAVVQLFYWNNFMHDKLYELGFTEAAGNFQSNNFGRGGLGNDAVQADAQDGGGFNNANFSTPPDGSAGRMQMYIFNSPTPQRDGDLDADVVLHEYTHGLSNRRVGGGAGISALQPSGMGEGWSDFYALSLLSEAGDDVNGVYAAGGYVTYQLSGMAQNYYFGIRRYPYCADMNKNPLTLKDIDPTQASAHTGIPRSPIIGTTANEVHNMGEVWCVTLWDARANLINKYGWSVGNWLMLQLVTDGMNLSPANPTYLQARDAILQADLVDTGGANRNVLWAAFAKRGMGASASCPVNSTTTGVVEAYDLPDTLGLLPNYGLNTSGQIGGPFSPNCQSYVISNNGSNALSWVAYADQSWIQLSASSGTLAAGTTNGLNVCLSAAVNGFPVGSYSGNVIISNTTSGVAQTRTVSVSITPPRIYFFSLDTDPGWTRQGEWAFGKPAGLGGTSFGLPDPTTGATGTNVFGINLNGDYSTAVGSAEYLIAGPLNFSGVSNVQLQFQRHLNSDYPPYVYETIDVSTNGATWSSIWANTSGVPISDGAWTPVSYDISAYANNCPNLYVRWGHQVSSSGAFAYSGWNIDDVAFLGSGLQSLALTIPASAKEGDGTVTGTLTVSSAPTTDLTVSLVSSDTTEATVPPTVTIPAGTTNVTFNLTIQDDGQLDGPQIATISASASGYTGTAASITILDNETASLFVSLPATATEGDGTVQGTIQCSAVPTADFSVALTSSDTTEIQVPGSVILPAGQTSVVFTATVVDDNQIDGPQNATVTAHVDNWTDGSTTITVLDNENTNLGVVLPASVWENAGPQTNVGLVTISGTLSTDLVVTLSSSVPGKLGVSATATVSAGTTNGAFSLFPIDNSIADGHQTVSITASAPGFVTGSGSMLVLDDESPPPPANPSPADLSSNVDQTTGLSWDSGVPPGTTLTNDVYFGTNPSPGAAEYVGTTTNSNWTVPVLAPLTTYYWQIIAHNGGSATGAVWRFTTRGVDHFVWDPISSPQTVDVPFSTTLTAKDVFGNNVTNFSGPARLSAAVGPNPPILFAENFEDGDFNGWTVGAGNYIRMVTNQTAAGGSNSLTLIGGNGAHGDGLSHTLSNITPAQVTFYVRASSTTDYGGYFVIGTGVTNNSSVAVFFYMRADATMGIIEDTIGYHGVPYNANQWYKISLKMDWANQREDFYVNDTLAYTNIPFRGPVTNLSQVYLYNFSNTQAWWDEIQFAGGSLAAPVTISPTTADNFTNGIWSGTLTVQQPATNIILTADDYNGHSGTANAFDAVLQDDIGISATATPNPVSSGLNLTYTLAVTNTGPSDATTVAVTNLLPSGVTFVSAVSSQGTCAQSGGVVSCDLGTIPGTNSATVSIVVTPIISIATLTNIATVSRAEPELYTDNNTVTTLTTVTPPAISISDASVVEGNSGTTNMVFSVNLSAPAGQTVTVNYATANGTATAGSDYASTNGILVFPPGTTNGSVVVRVFGDLLVEPNETLFVNLSSPVNGVLARSQGVGTIINDDGLPGNINSLQWDPIGSPQYVNQPFSATITARDLFNAVATNFNGSVSLNATGTAIGTNVIGTSTVQNPFPMYTGYNVERTQVIYPANSVGSAGLLRGLALNVAVIPGTMNNWTIRMKHTSISNYTSYVWESTNWTVVYQGNVSISSSGWANFTFPVPFSYNGSNNLMIDFSYNNTFSGPYGFCYSTAQPGVRTLFFYTYNSYGDPLTWTNSYPAPSSSTYTPNLQLIRDISVPISVSPSSAGPFTNGVWSGGITMLQPATNAILSAIDVDGHSGISNPFQVVTTNQPPAIISNPIGTNAYLGGTASFQVTALGAGTFAYQWRLNGNNIPGATNSTLVLNHVLLSSAGNYSVSVTNAFGSTSSTKVLLTVVQLAAWGAGTNTAIASPNYMQSMVPGLTNVTRLSGGLYHSVAAGADGKVAAWGAGTTNSQINPNYGQSAVPLIGSVAAVAAGGYHTLALRGDGTMAAWGAGTNPVQFSLPNWGQSAVPVSASNVVAIAAGDYHSVVLRNDGKVIVWGYNGNGQTNVPPTATNVVAIASRGTHVLAMRADGYLVHWGSQTALPIQTSNYVAIAAGVNHCLALRNDGIVVSFGGIYPVPNGLSNVVDIAAGYDHSLALKSDGTVVTWGATNTYGRNLIPAGLSNVVGIACGAYNSMAFLGDGSPVIKFQPVNRSALLFTPTSMSVLAVGQQLRYQWQLNGTNILNATNFIYTILNVQSFNAGNYRVVITNTYGAVTSSVVTLSVLAQIGTAVDAPGFTWTTSGNAAWFGETTISHDGVDAAQSGLITDNQQSTLQTTVAGPGNLSFWWKVSSEQYFDYLTFYIDGVAQAAISGEVNWQQQAFAIGSGTHTLRWTYQKDPSVSDGMDAGWLDQVVYTYSPPVITQQPIGQTNSMGATVLLSVSATGAPPFSYQWIKGGTNYVGDGSSILTITNATRHDSAAYSVVVGNPGGSVVSSNAMVLIRVPQQLHMVQQPDGTWMITSGDADGGALLPDDVTNLQAQASSNLVDWVPLTNSMVLTNGVLWFSDPDSTNYPTRFYRMIEY